MANLDEADTIRMSRWSSITDVLNWTNADVLVWGSTIHLSDDTINKLKIAGVTGKHILKMSREDMKDAGVDSALEQARLLGHVHLLNEQNDAPSDTDNDSTANSTDDANEGDRMRLKSVVGPRDPDAESLRSLRERVWDLFCQDEVASRTKRLFIEGDLIKYGQKSWSSDRRRFMLLDTALLWAIVLKRGATMADDKLSLKGRLDMGEFSVIDLPDGSKHGRKILNNAFKIFNIHKGKWYSLVCVSAAEKEKWMTAFDSSGVQVERLSAYKIDMDAKVASNMLLTDAERMELMSKVRDGELTVDDAMTQAESRENTLQEAFDRLTRERLSTNEINKADSTLDKDIETKIAEHNKELEDDFVNPQDVEAFLKAHENERVRLSTAATRTADRVLDIDIEYMIDQQNKELEDLDEMVELADVEKTMAMNNPYKKDDTDSKDDGNDGGDTPPTIPPRD